MSHIFVNGVPFLYANLQTNMQHATHVLIVYHFIFGFVAPSSPTNVLATVIDCAMIRVTWNPVLFNGTQLNTYKVYYQGSGFVEENVDASGTQKTLNGLNSLTTYSISVVAMNGVTESDRSSVIQNTTFGGELCCNSSYIVVMCV